MHWDFNIAHPTIWVFFAFVLVIAFLIKKGAWAGLIKALDKRAQDIQAELDEARKLREEANALLASYQRKREQAEKDAAGIIEAAKENARRLQLAARADREDLLQRREEQATQRIKAAEMQAIAEIKAQASTQAMNMVENVLRSQLTATDHKALFESSGQVLRVELDTLETGDNLTK